MTTDGYQPRGDELDAWDRVLSHAADGEGRALAIAAPAGFGKSTLLTLLASRATESGLRVLRTSGRLLDKDVSHSGTRQLFEAVLADERPDTFAGVAALARPLLAGQRTDADGFAQQHALFWCLSNWCAGEPLAVVVDDAQWLDPPSAAFVGYLVERCAELPLALLVAGRPHAFEESEALRVAWHRSDARRRLAALRTEQVLEAVESAGRRLSATAVDTVVALSSGNPFLVGELSRTLAGGEAQELVARSTAHAGPDVSAVVAEFVATRSSELGRSARRLLETAAVLGEQEAWALARDVAGLEDTPADGAWLELHDARLVAGDQSSIRFPHDLVWEAVLDLIAPARRSALHRLAGLALVERGRPDEAAAQFLAADPCGDPRVAEVLLDQARSERSRGAPSSAITLLRRALAEPPASELRTDVLVSLGEALLAAGQVQEAAEVLGRAVEDADDARRVTAARAAARALVFAGDPKAGAQLLERVGRDLASGSTGTSELRAEISAIGQAEHSLAAAASAGMREPAFPDGDLGRRAEVAMGAYDRVVVWAGSARDQARLLESFLDDAVEQFGVDSPMVAIVINGLVAGGGEGWAAARRALDAAESTARIQGSTGGVAITCTQRARLNILEGRLREAESDATLGLELAARGAPVVLPFAVASLAMCQTLQGRLEAADELMREYGFESGEVPSTGMGANLLLARLVLRREQGRLDDALIDLAGTAPFARGRGPWPSSWTPEAVNTLRVAGHRERAEALAREHHEQAERWGAPVHRAEAALLLSAFDADNGADLIQAALSVLDGVPARLTRARLLLALGASRRRANARREARDLLLEALEVATHCAAAPLVATVREELAAAGVRPRRVERSGVAALTPSELRIVRLAADGLTNPQIAQALFLSPKTVENHLSSAYAKLAVGSRRDLKGLDLDAGD